MRFILKTLFTLATLLILAAGALMLLVPRDVVRDQAIAFVKQQTGRTLTVDGETSFAFYPDIGVRLEDVTLSNPPGMKGGPMLRMASLTVKVKLLPLLSRSVQVERFTLQRPVFDLLIDAQGRRNWDFTRPRAAAQGPLRFAAAPHVRSDAPGFARAQVGRLGGGAIQELHLSAVRIVEGILLYSDVRTGTRQRLDAINLALAQKQLSQPLDVSGDFVWRGEKVALNGQIGTITALMRGGPSAVKFDIASTHLKSRFDGRVGLGAALTAAGRVDAETPSVRNLAAWSGAPLTNPKGFGAASLSGDIRFADRVLTFSKTRFSLDGMKGQGNGSLSLKGARPYLRAAFAIDTLNLNAYTGPGAAPPPPRPAAAPARAPAPAAAPARPKEGQSLTDFIEDLNKQPPQPQVRAWSRRAMNFAALNALNADVNVNAGALLFQRIKVGQSSVSASLREGVLTAELTKLQLYGGQGTGRVTVNGARA
ncbi:MAG: AsmA family protein, partial [Alphaproteobacteria bacterium]